MYYLENKSKDKYLELKELPTLDNIDDLLNFDINFA